MSASTKCRQCGADVDARAIFCSRCGQDMTLVGDDSATPPMTTAGSLVTPVRSTMRQALRDATLGEYEILSELGRGGMATVFLAHDIALDRKVAIKVMAPHLLEGEGAAERFKLEARTAAQLSHPHIIPIYAVKETSETLYFVMKFVEGTGLDALIKKTGALPIPLVKDVLTRVGGALGYAHRRDVVHRDIKPGNIMIDEEGTPVVTDFGIAKVPAKTGLTETGSTIGTPSYMSPEQCLAKPVTGASDQYSLGIVAFEMLTGKAPFEGDSAVATMYKHCHEPLPPLGDFRPDCPPELRETVIRMVAKDPAERWPSLEAAIRRLARPGDPGGPVASGAGAGTGSPGAASVGRSRTGLMAAVAVAAVLGVGLAITRPWARDTPAASGSDGTLGSVTPEGRAGPEPASAGDTGADTAGGTVSPAGERPGTGADPDTQNPTPPRGDRPVPAGATPPPPPVASIEISGSPERLRPGESARLSGTALDASGGAVAGSTVGWTSGDERVARVDATGTITAVAAGQTVLTASVSGVSSSIALTVAEAPVASIALGRTSLELTVGSRAEVTAQARDDSGSTLAGRQVTWQSSDESVALVSAGQVTGAGPGTAVVTASSEGRSASLDVTVRAATRMAIESLVAAYAEALESRDVARVRAVYPEMAAGRETQLRTALGDMEGLRVEYVIDSWEEQGNTATAVVSATYRFRGGGRDQVVPVPLRFTFERTPTSWRVHGIE